MDTKCPLGLDIKKRTSIIIGDKPFQLEHYYPSDSLSSEPLTYFIHPSALDSLDHQNAEDPQNAERVKIILASEVIKINLKNKRALLFHQRKSIKESDYDHYIDKEFLYVEDFLNQDFIHSDKPKELLKRIAEKAKNTDLFSFVTIELTDWLMCKIKSEKEAIEWVRSLEKSGLITYFYPHSDEYTIFNNGSEPLKIPHGDPLLVQMSTNGWEEYERLFRQTVTSKTAFIAMPFNDGPYGNDKRSGVQDAIEVACRECGFEASTVDRKEYNDPVVDKILSLVKTSHFIIAELTDNNSGVYWEAGYAAGLGIPVIYTFRKDKNVIFDEKKVHFDVRHLNIIVWDDLDILKEKIIDRIKGAILTPEERARMELKIHTNNS